MIERLMIVLCPFGVEVRSLIREGPRVRIDLGTRPETALIGVRAHSVDVGAAGSEEDPVAEAPAR